MSPRKRIATLGLRPNTVIVFTQTTASGAYARVQWRVRGERRTKSWPDTPPGRREAKAFAETLAGALTQPIERPMSPSLRELWARYTAAEFDHLRPKTRINYQALWRAWEIFAGRETEAATVTRDTLDEFRRDLRKLDYVVGQIRQHVNHVKRVYRWAVDRELVPPTKILNYTVKIAKNERPTETAEYTAAQAQAIIAALDPASVHQWRGWLFCTIAHVCGARAKAILHLTWADLDLEGAKAVVWRAAYDKTGVERIQPLPSPVVAALTLAKEWRAKEAYLGPWVFYSRERKSVHDRPWTYAALNLALHAAEKRAGVVSVAMNAAHRFRRGAMGDIYDLTGGDVMAALSWIGDTDARMIRHYLKKRDARMQEVADLLSAPAKEPE